MRRPPAATLFASIAAHGGAVALLFVLTSGESHPSVLFVDLEALAEREAPVAEPGSAASGGEAKRISTGSARPAGRDGGRPGPARSPAPAPAVSSPVTPSAPPEPASVREREEAQPANQETRQPESAVAIVPAREAPPDVAPSPSPDAPRENAGSAPGERGASTSEPGGGGRAAPGPGTSGAGPGGASGGTGLASGGPVGVAAGAEYGGYLAGVRRRILDALRYPPPARSRGLTGTVYLEIFIKLDGTIGDVSVTGSSSHPVLDEAALEAVRSLEPQPFPRGLKPRLLRVRLPVVFDLQ
jgi:periplasmic protein TonB